MTPSRQNPSHEGLLDPSRESLAQKPFSAIVVPTNRRVESLSFCMALAHDTRIPLIVICSKRVTKEEVIAASSGEDMTVYAVDLPLPATAPPGGISFLTSTDEDLLTFSSGQTWNVSVKRNLGLLIAKMLGWERLMFLEDDIYGISKAHVDALAAGLNNHHVSVLIPDSFPDNSVACHAHRLGGGKQGRFAGAGAMGVRCDRDELPLFPNIYNDDWFFFADEAAGRRIKKVGTSRQKEYHPYADPERAVKEEFGDLLAEGLYWRLDQGLGLSGVDTAFWQEFIGSRGVFLNEIDDSLAQHPERELDSDTGRDVRAARVSISAAQRQLERITPEPCQRFIDLWRADLDAWRRQISQLPRADSIAGALDSLAVRYATAPPSTR